MSFVAGVATGLALGVLGVVIGVLAGIYVVNLIVKKEEP